MSWPIVGIVGVVLLFIFSYGVMPSPPSKPIHLSSFLDLNDTPNTYSGQAGKVPTVNGTENGLIFLDVNGGGGLGDTNQVKVSANDTTPDYLFSKLQAGSNITLTIQNAGGDENILISSTATGGSGTGRTYNSGTPATIQVNNDNNTISQNFDGNFASRFDANFWRMFALGEPYIDGNALAIINALDLNNSLSYLKIGQVDGNGSILGTTNQVSVTNGLSRLVGGDSNVVLSLPQNIDTSATPQFAGLTLSPCSTFQIDSSPQLRFKVDCAGPTVSSTTFIPVSAGITDIGTASNRWDDLWITDVNATGTGDFKILKYDGNTVLTQQDSNSFYVKLYSDATQIINGAVSNILDLNGNLRPLLTNTWGLGTSNRRWGQSYINQIITNPGTGEGALEIVSNTGAFCIVNSDICLDYNSNRFVGLTDMNIPYWMWGMTGSAYGLGYQSPRTAVPQFLGGLSFNGQYYVKDFNNPGASVQMQRYRNGAWEHENAKMNLGTPNDGIIDANWLGDVNATMDWNGHGNLVVDKNIYGQLISAGNLVGVSCNTTCGSYSYAGPWVCVEADNVTGAGSTCSDVTVAHNCLCRN